MITKIELGNRIAASRKKKGLSQTELGVFLGGITHASVSDIERGKTTLGIEDISNIAKILGVSFEELTLDYSSTNFNIYNLRSIHSTDDKEELEKQKAIDSFFEKVTSELSTKK